MSVLRGQGVGPPTVKVSFRPGVRTRYALYMAVLDDEICRNELEGNRIGDEVITFPPKEESLQYRYHLFLELNRTKDRRQLQQEIADLEQRLQESRQYRDQPKERLEVEFVE